MALSQGDTLLMHYMINKSLEKPNNKEKENG